MAAQAHVRLWPAVSDSRDIGYACMVCMQASAQTSPGMVLGCSPSQGREEQLSPSLSRGFRERLTGRRG